MVGARGFEPPTPGPPDQCANQTALRPELVQKIILNTTDNYTPFTLNTSNINVQLLLEDRLKTTRSS